MCSQPCMCQTLQELPAAISTSWSRLIFFFFFFSFYPNFCLFTHNPSKKRKELTFSAVKGLGTGAARRRVWSCFVLIRRPREFSFFSFFFFPLFSFYTVMHEDSAEPLSPSTMLWEGALVKEKCAQHAGDRAEERIFNSVWASEVIHSHSRDTVFGVCVCSPPSPTPVLTDSDTHSLTHQIMLCHWKKKKKKRSFSREEHFFCCCCCCCVVCWENNRRKRRFWLVSPAKEYYAEVP